MDNRPAERLLLDQALAALHAQGVDALVLAQRGRGNATGEDVRVRVTFGRERVEYPVEIRRTLTPATLGVAVDRLKRMGEPGLLVTGYLTPPLAEKLRAMNVAFADTAGNAFIHRPPVLVWITGRRPGERRTPPRAGRAFGAAGLRVLFALLCKPELVARPYREIAAEAGVAHGTVGWVLADLPEHGHLLEPGGTERPRQLVRAGTLLDRWAEAYAPTLRPKLIMRRLHAEDPRWREKVKWPNYEALLGGEPAGARLTDFLRPGGVTLYARQIPGKLLVDYRLRTDPKGEVEILRRFWPFETEPPHTDLTPPVLVYADLLATGDARCIETAGKVRERYLGRLKD